MVEVSEVRRFPRYNTVEPLVGSFGAAEVVVRNLGERGAQVSHAQPLRIGTRSRFWFRRGDISVSIQATIVWSHLSQVPDEHGKLLYQSGLHVDEDEAFLSSLQAFADRGVIKRDLASLERKKKVLLEKEQAKSGKPIVKFIQHEPDVPADQKLMIEHARARLQNHPDEAQRFYERAKASNADEIFIHREDVVAVWEYLERTIDLSTIVKVFEKRG
ncbi:MAG TPA: hypothetical protein VMU84_00845 [Thermoanaerobaculia bacterium]|nr:hypothetical protein [Thermoanaerobaculia bacterium]